MSLLSISVSIIEFFYLFIYIDNNINNILK